MRVLIVGSGAEWTKASVLATQDESVAYLTLEAALGVGQKPIPYSSIVDVAARNLDIERQAWAWACDLARHLGDAGGPWSSQELRVIRRRAYSNCFKLVAAARAKAAVLGSIDPQAAKLSAIGLSDVEVLAIAEVFPQASIIDTAGVTKAGNLAGASSKAEHGPVVRIARKAARIFVNTAKRSLAAAKWRLRRRRIVASLAKLRRSRRSPGVAVILISHDPHVKLLRSTLDELRSHGWSLVLALAGPATSLSPQALPLFDQTVYMSDLTGAGSHIRSGVHSPYDSSHLNEEVGRWASREGLESYTSHIADKVGGYLRPLPSRMHAQRLLLEVLRPRFVLSVSETSAMVEEVASNARVLGIPTVNVQHGVIAQTYLRAEFEFDSFCVYGHAYADMLASLGTPIERIRVVGNPFLDASSDEMVPVPIGGTPDKVRARDDSGELTLLFAAQHQNSNLSNLSLYSSLSPVLAHAERHSGIKVIVKLHPYGEGKELGYDLAISEHPAANVTQRRHGDLHQMIRESDCVVTYSSTVGFEAVTLRRPVIVINPVTDIKRNPLVAEGVALPARDLEEFGQCVDSILAGERLSEQCTREFDQRYAFKRDGMSGKRIADICEELAR